MQHYTFDLLENLTGKELVWHISNLCLCQMLCNMRVTDITAWGNSTQAIVTNLYLERNLKK